MKKEKIGGVHFAIFDTFPNQQPLTTIVVEIMK